MAFKLITTDDGFAEDLLDEDVSVFINTNKQMLVFQSLTLAGTIMVDGKLVILG